MSKLIAIVGITGNQGASVADVFLAAGWRVRGISRDPSKPSSKAWSDKGVEMVAADLDDAAALTAAFAGATVIYGVTDFWQGMSNPANHAKAAKEGRTINEICYDIEVQQGRNIVDAASKTTDSLEYFVLSTLSWAKKWSKGDVTFNLHFDAKWMAVEYVRETYPELWGKTSLLQVALFATNWQSGKTMRPNKQADGTYLLKIPVRPDSKIPMVHPRKDCGHFVHALVSVPPGKNLLGVASSLSWSEWAQLWAKTVGVECKYEQMPYGEMDKLMPGGMGAELEDMFKYMDLYGYDGSDPTVVLPKDLGVDVPVTTIEEYMKMEDWSSVLSA
ncbi:NAD(P)-binding protein [Aulographum hederae CBS 113979]|uniref:NAD(P)-binding protein n=1 Tax=Aulographum hederae CBS 113979 TaxID=1176131 RepID=A0A6G1HDZ5_9PEZI|nr:NAD(P)-binding protein [Aulographum hederae CBS 113979]